MSTPRPAAALNRRQFLTSSTAFAALALAGCASDDDLLKPRQPLFESPMPLGLLDTKEGVYLAASL